MNYRIERGIYIKMPPHLSLWGIYFAVVSLVAVIVTTADKIKAKAGAWRVKEATLLLLSAIGGSVAMLITMLVIRHKTKHAKFMLGIPLIIAVQIAAFIFFVL